MIIIIYYITANVYYHSTTLLEANSETLKGHKKKTNIRVLKMYNIIIIDVILQHLFYIGLISIHYLFFLNADSAIGVTLETLFILHL